MNTIVRYLKSSDELATYYERWKEFEDTLSAILAAARTDSDVEDVEQGLSRNELDEKRRPQKARRHKRLHVQ